MARNSNHTKELIERTALRLFVEKGITETTIRDIAAAGQVSPKAPCTATSRAKITWPGSYFPPITWPLRKS